MSLHPSAQKVQDTLRELGFSGEVLELENSTRTAAEAAQAAGCEIGQIVKSLVFRLEPEGTPLLVLVSGANRVHEKRLGRQLGGNLEKADADFVYQVSGFAIGGVPPVGHKTRMQTCIDEDLLLYDIIWAAAGTPHAIFRLTPADLVNISGGAVLSVK
jgi:prolyl-tRNA editing enzyme YbaK/EbsC (Cys-tRNA(Pro) deacylase)